jgi:hypothetical protein
LPEDAVGKMKHQFRESLHHLFIVFKTIEQPHSFTIEYQIHEANLVDAAEGMLHVVRREGKVSSTPYDASRASSRSQ